jgi:predicted HAD superfamily Cof-like phosphohydrolase
MSNFDKVVDFNKTFNVKTFDKPFTSVFSEYPDIVELRMKLIREEVEELEQAVKAQDMKETIDALSDILYVVYGMGDALGIDLDNTFNMVHRSNMSKVCNNEKEAQETVQWYKDNSEDYNTKNPAQAPVEPTYTFFNGKYVINNKKTGKVLKSIYYKPVDFTDYLKNHMNIIIKK